MFASASLIPELEDMIQHGSQDKRAKMLKRIANLFVDGSPHFNEDHIGLFDDVLCRLVVELAQTKGQAHLAAIAGRSGIGEAITDVLVRRGDTDVVRNVAHNQTAKLS